MFMLNNKKEELEKQLSKHPKCLFVVAEKGLGKSRIINDYLLNKSFFTVSTFMASISVLATAVQRAGLDYSKDNNIHNLTVICNYLNKTKTRSYLFFDDFELYDTDTKNLILSSLSFIAGDNITIIIAVDPQIEHFDYNLRNSLFHSNPCVYITQKDFQNALAENQKDTLATFDESDRQRVLLLCRNFIDLNYLISTSENFVNSGYSLYKAMDDVIKERIDSFTEDIKDVLYKSALVGNTFYDHTLNTVFELNDLADKLNSLEQANEISQIANVKSYYNLQHDEMCNQYSFNFENSLPLIRSSLKRDYKRNWWNLLGDHFFALATKTRVAETSFDLYNISFEYYISSVNGEKIIQSGLILCKLALTFEKKYKFIEIAKKVINASPHELVKKYLMINILSCMIDLALFKEAITEYNALNDCNLGYTSLNWDIYAKYYHAYAQYNVGSEVTAFKIITSLLPINAIDKRGYNKELGAMIYSLYASILNNRGEQCVAKKAFALAKNYAQFLLDKTIFHRLECKSGMFYSNDLAKKSIENANIFFSTGSMKIDCGKCRHNLGVLELNNRNYESAMNYFSDSASILSSCFSNHVYYSFNNLGATLMYSEKYIEAIEYFNKVISNAESQDIFTLVEVYFNLSACYYKVNDYIESERFSSIARDYIKSHKDITETYFFQLFDCMHEILYSIEKGDLVKANKLLEDFVPTDEEYEHVKKLLNAKLNYLPDEIYCGNKKNLDIVSRNVFPHILLFWE